MVASTSLSLRVKLWAHSTCWARSAALSDTELQSGSVRYGPGTWTPNGLIPPESHPGTWQLTCRTIFTSGLSWLSCYPLISQLDWACPACLGGINAS